MPECDRQLAGEVGLPEEQAGKRFASTDSRIPRFHNGGHVLRPRHQNRIAALDDHNGMRVSGGNFLDERVLAIGQGERFQITAFVRVLGHEYDGDIRLLCGGSGGIQISTGFVGDLDGGRRIANRIQRG